MSRNSLRKTVSAGLGVVLMGSALTIGLGSSVAAATPGCAKIQSVTKGWLGSFGTPYTISKEVMGDGTAAAGAKVTYQTTVSGSGAVVNEVRDFHPAGFNLVGARINYGNSWSDVTASVQTSSTRTSAGGVWSTSFGGTVVLETTYQIPAGVTVGSQLDSGAGTNVVLDGGNWDINPMGVCVTIRKANIVEAGTGSLEGQGLGSVNTAFGNIFGSVVDPSGSVGNLVGGSMAGAS